MICGGYDPANIENVQHYSELLLVAQGLGLKTRELRNYQEGGKITLRAEEPILPKHTQCLSQNDASEVYFLRSFTDTQRAYLLSHSLCILYTPSNEHFGIVPVEAMYMKRPVVACRSGGPRESVRDFNDSKSSKEKPTGFLCQPTPTEWRDTIRTLVASEESSRLSLAPSLGETLGEAGRLKRAGEVSLHDVSKPTCAACQGDGGGEEMTMKQALSHDNVQTMLHYFQWFDCIAIRSLRSGVRSRCSYNSCASIRIKAAWLASCMY